ncbi:cytochrome b5 [Aureobasidium subglaciale]|nr:cytochrome b5 [Aureobasidium subglaciale]
MAEVRKRAKAADATVAPKEASTPTTTTASKKSSGVGLTDVLRVLGGLFLLSSALSYFVTSSSLTWGWRPWYSKPALVASWLKGPVYLTDAELAAYNGKDASKPVYIALNGTIYDVSAGRHVYGPGGSYNFFAGRDATRAFITGCFQEDLTPDTRGAELTYIPVDDDVGVSKAELKKRRERDTRLAKKRVHDTIDGWSRMFRGEAGKDYFEVGKVKREEGWLEKLPRRKLCEQAQNQRPKRKE